MAKLIRVKSRLLLQNGDYNAVIRNNTLTMVYQKEKIALTTHQILENRKMKHEYDGKLNITQVFENMSEKRLFKQVINELDNAIKNKSRLQNLSYQVEDIE